jgi:uncharacterized protein (UPF0335 family)
MNYDTTTPHVPKAAAKAVAAEAVGKKTSPASSKQIEAFSDDETGRTHVHKVAREQLRSFIERIERLEEEKKTIADDIKDIYSEAKGTGFDTKILKKVISIRKQDKDERMEQEAILETYLLALGMLESRGDD